MPRSPTPPPSLRARPADLALLLLAALACAPLDAQVPDRSAELVLIGNPLAAAGYTGTNPHRNIKDLRHHFGRLYVGYGHTNSGNAHRFLYGDPTAMTVGAETSPDFTITEEEQTHFRVFDDVLHLVSYDATSGAQYYTRTPAGVWSKLAVNGGSDHARDLVHHGERVWYANSNGTTTSPYPDLLWAPRAAPSGAFTRHTQPKPAHYTLDGLREGFFHFAGRLYAVGPNYTGGQAPFLLRHNSNDHQAWWSVAVHAPQDILPAPYAFNVNFAAPTGLSRSPAETWHAGSRRLFFAAQVNTASRALGLFHTPDPEATPASPLPLPDAPGGVPLFLQLLRREGRLFAVVFHLEKSPARTTVQIHQLAPGSDPSAASSWPALFRFTTPAMLGSVSSVCGSAVDYADGVFYFSADATYDHTTNQLLDPADLRGSVYKLPFPGVLGPVATPPPELPSAAGLSYSLDDYDDRRTDAFSAVSGTTLSRTDADAGRAGLEGLVTRTAASSGVQFLQRSLSRAGALTRALAATDVSGRLRVRAKVFANDNPDALRLRWGIQADTWPGSASSQIRRFTLSEFPAAATTETWLELDLAANPDIAAAARAFRDGSGTSFRLFIDNGPGPYWSGAVRFVVDDFELVELPRPAPAPPSAFTATLVSSSLARLSWGPARPVAQGCLLERRAGPSSPWEQIGLHGGDATSADVPAGPDPEAALYRLTPYTHFGRGPAMQAAPSLTRAAWRELAFSPADLADPARETTLWGDAADPDADGLPNLLEYALDADPLAPSPSDARPYAVTLSETAPHALRLSFTRRRADLRYEVLAGSDLAVWTVIASDPGEFGQPVVVADPAPGPRRFLRLRVTPR